MSGREVRFFDRRLFLRGAGAAPVGVPALSFTAVGCGGSPRAFAASPLASAKRVSDGVFAYVRDIRLEKT